MDDQSFKHLCRAFADNYGCTVVERDPDLWNIELSPQLAQRFNQRRWVLCFHRSLLEVDPEAQLVTAGAQVVQTIKETLDREGLVAESSFRPSWPLPTTVPTGISPLTGTLTFIQTRVFYYSLARVNFRLSILGVERHEEYFPVILEGHKLTSAADRLAGLLAAHTPVARLAVDAKIVPVREAEFIEAAYKLAEDTALKIVADFQEQAVRETNEERAQAIEYFDRMELQEADTELKASLPAIRKRKLAELDERARVEVELEAHGVQFYRLPVARTEVQFTDGAASKKLAVDTDLLTGQLLIGTCGRHPNTRMDRLTLCEAHGLGCTQCHWKCVTCNKTGCPECTRFKCTECRGPHCASCVRSCAGCGERLATDHLTQCTSGCGLVCSSCLRHVDNRLYCLHCTVVADCHHQALKKGLATCAVDAQTLCPVCARLRVACTACHALCCSKHLHDCAGDGESVCEKCALRLADGRRACTRHGTKCSCNRGMLATEVDTCPAHGRRRCANCQWTCTSCKTPRCGDCEGTQCQACGGRHCVECVFTCTVCNSSTGKVHGSPCASGCGEICPKCFIVLGSDVHCTRCTTRASCGHVEATGRLSTCGLARETFCRKCSTYLRVCTICRKTACQMHFNLCAGGGEIVCTSCAPGRLANGTTVCTRHAGKCQCGVLALLTELQKCAIGGHGVSCSKCRWQCSTCPKVGCSQCEGVQCRLCGKNHCADCLDVCSGCGDRTGRTHLTPCSSGCGTLCDKCTITLKGKAFCRHCTTTPGCGHVWPKSQVVTCAIGLAHESMCGDCGESCLTSCGTCDSKVCRNHRHICAEQGEVVCGKCAVAVRTGSPPALGRACKRHVVKADCGHLVLHKETTRCTGCTTVLCMECRISVSSGGYGCKDCTVSCRNGHREICARASSCHVCGVNYCSHAKCQSALGTCQSCGRQAAISDHHLLECTGGDPICSTCASVCAVCSPRRVVCTNHGSVCTDCGKPSCTSHALECLRCGAQMCSNCHPYPACRLCASLLPVTEGQAGRLINAVVVAGLFPKGSFIKIRVSMGSRRSLLEAETGTLFKKRVLASISNDGQVVRCVTYNFGQQIFGGRTDLK